MDCSELVLSVIKEPTIKENLNPVLYYSIKQIYSPEFSKRSRYFCSALKKFFENVNKSLKMEDIIMNVKAKAKNPIKKEENNNQPVLVEENKKEEEENKKEEDNKKEEENKKEEDNKKEEENNPPGLDVPEGENKKDEEIKSNNPSDNNEKKENNKCEKPENYNELDLVLKEIQANENEIKDKNLLKTFEEQDEKYFIEKLLEYDDTYILDKDDEYLLLYLIRDYVMGSTDPSLSELMQGYNLFVSSVELIFCLKLVLKFPNLCFSKMEKEMESKYFQRISERVKGFCKEWRRVYPKKYAKNKLIQTLIKDFGEVKEQVGVHNNIDYITLSLDEPILTPKYVSFIKLIREGPFFYEIDEIARQMCLIDHSFFSSIPQKDYIDYIVRKEIPDSFNKIYKREKHFKCYILMFLLLIRNLENQKNAIQNFIALAHQCKTLNNFQTEYTIISTFSAIGISKKELLWRLIEKKYRDIYQALETEFLDVDLNEKTIDQFKKGGDIFIPHIDLVKNQINNFIIQIKMSGEQQKKKLCTEYRDFYSKIANFNNNKYSFFVVNPLYDFLKSGFWEICKNKHWGIKAKYDFSSYSDEDSDAEKLFDILVKLYKKKDKTIV